MRSLERKFKTTFKAGAQEIGWLFEYMSWKEVLIMYGFTPEDKMEEILHVHYPDIPVRHLNKEEVLRADPEKAVLMVKQSRQSSEFTDHFLLGHIISLEDTTNYYKFSPMNYSLEAA